MMKNPTRRELLEIAAALAALPVASGMAEAAQVPAAPANAPAFAKPTARHAVRPANLSQA